MKKTALTIGLFSLVMVATSFANPTVQINSIETEGINPPIGNGASTGGGRKQDFHATANKLEIKNNQSGFSEVNQSLGGSRKVD